MRNRLYKSRDKIIAGVCSGLAEWLGLSTGVVRFIVILLVIFPVRIPVVTIYILLAIFLPKAPYREYREYREWY